MHVCGAEQCVVLEGKDKGLVDVEGSARDIVVELQASEALAGEVHGEGLGTSAQRVFRLRGRVVSLREANTGTSRQ